jgi:two-component system chemotaxis sensor kinase CheA
MSSLEQLKLTFFDECAEALQQIENGLTAIRDGEGDAETINAVFRAVHSVKGGAGIFGFEDLIGFAHVFETVLDAMRSNKLSSTPESLDVLLSANDVLTDLITMARTGQPIAADFGATQKAALEALLGKCGEAPTDDEGPAADFDDLDFMPVRADNFDDIPGERRFQISFRPKADMLRRANEPLYIVRELRKLGTLELVADLERLPPLSEIDADSAYIGWTGTLTTTQGREQIQEVFEFVSDDCEIDITELDPPMPSFEPVAVELPPEPPAPIAEMPSALAPAAAPAVPEPLPEVAGAPSIVPPAEPTRTAAPALKPAATTMRVELEKIDRVVNMVGELVIAQAMLGQIVHGLPEEASSRLAQVLEEVIHHTRELKDSVMSMRAQSIGAVFQRMPRLVRELAAKTGKKVRLEMHGENTEVDRSIIERLGDPLTHIIRNSIDHGIETPATRLAAGKPEEGTVRLAADHRGGRIVIEVSDDGGGIDSERVLKKARERGLVAADAQLTEDEINNLIFMPGFSTAETVSDISGRGVGMDVVRRNIQEVGGRISLKSDRGRGMVITLALPLTLAVMDGMVIKVGLETYVIPMSAIVECLRPRSNEMHNLLGGRGVLQLRGNVVPLVHLGDLLDVGAAPSASEERVVIIADVGDNTRFGIIVDELCGHQQVVVKSLEESYGAVPGVAGATILGNGRVALILDVEKLSDLASGQAPRPAYSEQSAR